MVLIGLNLKLILMLIKLSKGAALGAVFCFVVSLLLAALVSALISSGTLPGEGIAFAVPVITLISAGIGGMIAARKAGSQRLAAALLCAVLYLLVAFVLRGLIYGSVSQKAWLIPALAAGGSVLGSILASLKR